VLGLVRIGQRNSAAALPLLEESRTLYKELGDVWGEANTLYQQGLPLWQDMQRVDNGFGILRGLAGMAEVAAAQGQAERAGRLFGVADRLLPSASNYRDDLNRHVAEARSHLDATAFTAGWTAGQAMTEEQAVTDALQDA
jgi:hypothetical protein